MNWGSALDAGMICVPAKDNQLAIADVKEQQEAT
jgi:hypothetical protein